MFTPRLGGYPEKQPYPLPADVFLTGSFERVIMQIEHRIETDAMWDRLRDEGEMICDAPARKVGTPFASPYSVMFPVEIDGELVFVDLDIEHVKRLAYGLLSVLPEAIELTNKADAEFLASEALTKAKACNG